MMASKTSGKGTERSAWGKGGLYKRSVFEKDPETGKTAIDGRGNKIVKYDYWQATYEVPTELLPEGIDRKRITGNGASQTAALRALRANRDEFLERKANGEPLFRTPRKKGTKRATVNKLFDDWLSHKADEDISTTVLRKYRRMYEQHIRAEIGAEYLDKITVRQLTQLMNSTLLRKKKTDATGKPIPGTNLLGSAARLNIWKVLRMCFTWGERSDYFVGRSNPMMLVKQPRVVKREIDIDARVRDADILMAWLKDNRPELLAQFGLQLLGLRQMERLGLRISDIKGRDTDHPKILVSGQLTRNETEDVEKYGAPRWERKERTKTGVSREIPLREPFLTYLEDHLKRREENSKKPGYKDWGDDKLGNLLFLTERGALITKSTDGKVWKEVCEAAGIEPFQQHINRFITTGRTKPACAR
jgi:hypothetical protein